MRPAACSPRGWLSSGADGTVTLVPIRQRWIAFVFRVVLVVFCASGLALNTNAFTPAFTLGPFNYYTILSNTLVFVAFIVLVIRTATDAAIRGPRGTTEFSALVTGLVVLAISVTGLVYNFVLVPTLDADQAATVGSAANLFVHAITPSLVVLDFLLFVDKRRMRWFHPLVWLVVPLVYVGFALIRAEVGAVLIAVDSRYPYFFIDVDQYGWGAVARNIGYLAAAFLALGYVIVLLDRVWPHRRRAVTGSGDPGF